MKRYFVSFMFVLVFSIISAFVFTEKRPIDVKDVFLEKEKSIYDMNENEYYDFYLLFDEINLNIRNLKEYFNSFSDVSRIRIYPYYPTLQHDILSNQKEYYEISGNLDTGINNMNIKYMELLSDNGLDAEMEKAEAEGIRINKIMINSSAGQMIAFLQNNSDVKYSIDGSDYKKIKR